MNIYRFKVDYFSDDTLKSETCKGFVPATSFGEAMKCIEEYIGSGNIIDVKSLYPLDDIIEDTDIKDIFDRGE